MTVVDYGFPNRTFFEIYAGEHPSKKIYSVQVKDWEQFFSIPIQKGSQENIHTEYIYQDRAAVAQVDLSQVMTNHKSHMQVEPTADLVAFMNSRGISLPDTIYVQPLAFAWSRDGEFEIEEDIDVVNPQPGEPQPDSGEKNGSKTKAILAAIVAVLAAIN